MICFLDIDGVIGDFAERSKRIFGVEIEARKLLPTNSPVIQTLKTNSAVCREFVLGIPLYWYAPDLLKVLNENFEKILICSKPLTPAYEEARFEWVRDNLGEKYSKNFIHGVKQKEIFACSSSFLIDDIKDNCMRFIHNGGYALHWHEECFERMIRHLVKLRNTMAKTLYEILELENIK